MVLMPFLYIVLGYFIGKIWGNTTKYISYILINILIPTVVFFTILTYSGSILYIIIISYAFSLCMYFISKYLFKKNLTTAKSSHIISVNTIFSLVLLLFVGVYIQYL